MLEKTRLPTIAVPFRAEAAISPTLPGSFYYDPVVYEEEIRSVFFRSWQFVAHVSKLREPGQYIVVEVHDQSVIVIRSAKNTLKAFYNVCQHRAHRLMEGEGSVKASIICPYHNWRYSTDGSLTMAKRTENMQQFDVSDICLRAVKVGELAGLIFINLDPDAASLSDTYPGLEDEIRSFRADPESLNFAYTKNYPLNANWKNSVENYSECYHCPGCHPRLSREALDLSNYSISLHKNYHMHLSSGQTSKLGYPPREAGARSDYFGAWFIWPNVCVEFYPGGYMNVLHHRPTGPETTTQVVEWYCTDVKPSQDEQEVIDFVAITREEDLPICESVQRGLHSKGYSQGRFVVDPENRDHSEHAVHDFQHMVLAHLDDALIVSRELPAK